MNDGARRREESREVGERRRRESENRVTGLTRKSILTTAGLTALSVLAGCTGAERPRETSGAPEATATPEPASSPSAGPGVLLVFFSRAGENYWDGGRRNLEVGNTNVVAQIIAELINCDTYEIRATDPYPDAYDATVDRNRQEQNDDARPAILDALPDLGRYDTVLLGCPVWNSSAPMIMHTFIEGVDLAGRTVLPFVTYAVSGMSGIDDEFREALPASEVRDGLAVRGEEASDSADDIEQWLKTNGLG